MIYSDKDILYAIELRLICNPISGSLCRFIGTINNAIIHWGVYHNGEYFSNPWRYLTSDIISQLSPEMLRVFSEYNNKYQPKFSNDELFALKDLADKIGVNITIYNHKLIFTG